MRNFELIDVDIKDIELTIYFLKFPYRHLTQLAAI